MVQCVVVLNELQLVCDVEQIIARRTLDLVGHSLLACRQEECLYHLAVVGEYFSVQQVLTFSSAVQHVFVVASPP